MAWCLAPCEEFLVSLGGLRGDKNRETLYRFVGRAGFTIFLRAVAGKAGKPVVEAVAASYPLPSAFYSHNLIISAL